MPEELERLMVGSAIGVWDAPVGGQQVKREMTAVLAQVPLFAELSQRHLGRVASVAAHKHYLAGAELVRAGAPADAFYVILAGSARVEIAGGPVALEPGNFFGEMGLVDGEPRSATVTAATDVVVLVIARKNFLALLVAEPKVALGVLVTITRRLRAAQGEAP